MNIVCLEVKKAAMRMVDTRPVRCNFEKKNWQASQLESNVLKNRCQHHYPFKELI